MLTTITSSVREPRSVAIARSIGKPLWEARTEADALPAKVEMNVVVQLTAAQRRQAWIIGGAFFASFSLMTGLLWLATPSPPPPPLAPRPTPAPPQAAGHDGLRGALARVRRLVAKEARTSEIIRRTRSKRAYVDAVLWEGRLTVALALLVAGPRFDGRFRRFFFRLGGPAKLVDK